MLPGAVNEGSGFASEPFNDVTIVDAPSAAFVFGGDTQARQFHDDLAFEITTDTVMVEMKFKLTTNQSGRHGVENAAHINGAATADPGGEDFVIGHPFGR
ncbi:MAG: hypothetical protein F6K42_33315 [Leptolyngbya sp. SIO1D8]|nr:hypothetical protein [Leptolyngbya sp. SIO1D8]